MGKKAVEEILITERMDNISGELVRQDVKRNVSITGSSSSEPNYVKLYIKAWCKFKEIKGINSALLYELLQYMTYANKGQRIYLHYAMKEEIAESLGWSGKYVQQHFNKELKKLLAAGVLKREKKGVFIVNPELIGKGNWADVKKFRATFNLIGTNAGKVMPEME